MNESQNTGEKLKKIRKEKGLTQRELSLLMDVSRSAVANIENGIRKPNIEYLYQFKKVLALEKGFINELQKSEKIVKGPAINYSLLNSRGIKKLTEFYEELIKNEEFTKKS